MAKKIKVGIVGCGNIGSNLARFICTELKDSMSLTGIYDIDEKKAKAFISGLRSGAKLMPVDKLIEKTDLLIETAQIDAARDMIEKAVKRQKDIIVLSLGAFVRYPSLVGLIRKSKGNVYIPSGAICGLDGIRSAAAGGIEKICLTTSKPPRSISGVPYLEKKKIDVFKLKKRKLVFKGSVREAIECFPKNINVAAAISLASGCKDLEVRVEVDPALKRNRHKIEVFSKAARINIEVENMPSPENPKSSYLTVLSARSLLKKIASNIKIGS